MQMNLEAIVGTIILDSENMIINGEYVSTGTHQISQMQRLS